MTNHHKFKHKKSMNKEIFQLQDKYSKNRMQNFTIIVKFGIYDNESLIYILIKLGLWWDGGRVI